MLIDQRIYLYNISYLTYAFIVKRHKISRNWLVNFGKIFCIWLYVFFSAKMPIFLMTGKNPGSKVENLDLQQKVGQLTTKGRFWQNFVVRCHPLSVFFVIIQHLDNILILSSFAVEVEKTENICISIQSDLSRTHGYTVFSYNSRNVKVDWAWYPWSHFQLKPFKLKLQTWNSINF